KAQLRALFAAAADPASAPGRPVRLSETRAAPRGTPPAGLIGAPAGEVAARFQPRGLDEVAPGRFSGAAVKPLPARR
ncbi:peptidase domain containing protein, partial [Methylobacterium isbiliense]|nr:peptidase domain containing protein [Methylobacterium isbiliense]